MSGPLFAKEEDRKRRLSQARASRFGPPPRDNDVFLAQMAMCAAELRIDNPYPAPSREVDLTEGQRS